MSTFSLICATRLENGISMWEKHIFMRKGSKRGLLKNFGPIWGFKLKTVPGIDDPHISWLPFETKNHEMKGPPVIDF